MERSLLITRLSKKIFVFLFIAVGFSLFAKANDVVPGEYLVKFKPMTVDGYAVQGKIQNKAYLKSSFPSLNLYHIALKNGPQDLQSLQEIQSDPDVDFIEPNYILKKGEDVNQLSSTFSRDDVVAAGQVSTSSTEDFSQNSAPVQVEEAWGIYSSVASKGKVTVAVIDTGLDSTHDVFKTIAAGGSGSLWINTNEVAGNGVDDDNNGYVDDVSGWNFITNTSNFYDDEGHGTHVSGIVVGTSIDIMATTLLESKISIMPLKFLDANGSGSTSNAIKAMYYAVNNGAKVINNSWGGSAYSKSLHDAMTYAYNNQVIVVSAAGNYAKNNDSNPIYPANYDVPSNLAVASSTSADKLSSFSNYGVSKVPVVAPGSYITSTIRGNYYGVMSGTSMAAPFVAGLAALIKREASQLTGYQIKQILIEQVDVKSAFSGKVQTSGRVNTYKVVQRALAMTATSAAQPSYTVNYLEEGAKSSSGGGGGGGGGSTESSSPKGGCGLVSTAVLGSGSSGSSAPLFRFLQLFVYLMLLTAPLVVWFILRKRHSSKDQRKHERFKLNSKVNIMLGDRELVGAMRTISMGGVSFNADTALDKGGIITMKIQSPDGQDVIEVQGEVVWNESNQNYGVRFQNASGSMQSLIQNWTKNLIKAN